MSQRMNIFMTSISEDLPTESFQSINLKPVLKMTEEIDDEFGDKVKDLATEIEKVKKASGLSYIETVVEVCERLGLEVEDMKKALPKNIKEKIELEASELNLLKVKPNRLV